VFGREILLILAIDPGSTESAYVVLDKELRPVKFGKINNFDLLNDLKMDRFHRDYDINHFVIEMIASYGMGVGKEVFETCVWIGRFAERANFKEVRYIYRKDEKMNLCGTMRAKDSNIIQALKDRFGDKGTKKNPGWFYGFSKDIWQAYAVGVTYYDLHLKGDGEW
jgi:hypothetical protein